LHNVSLAVPAGCILGVIGPNRAGKTTLVKVLLGICRPTSGAVLRLGRPGDDRRTLAPLARVGYVHESHAFPKYLTAAGLLRYYGCLSGVPAAQLRRWIPQGLAEVGLADRAREPIRTFSKGMLRRLALAQSLVNDPELLVLDEPAEGMDLAARRTFHDVLCRRRSEGRSTILVSHAVADIQRLCDEVAVLRGGQLIFCGPLAELAAPAPSTSGPALELSESLEQLYEATPT
jgi:ABC-2 type transport system ATP-binding protein